MNKLSYIKTNRNYKNIKNKKIKLLFKDNKDFLLKIQTIYKLKNNELCFDIFTIFNDFCFHVTNTNITNSSYNYLNHHKICITNIRYNDFNTFYKDIISNNFSWSQISFTCGNTKCDFYRNKIILFRDDENTHGLITFFKKHYIKIHTINKGEGLSINVNDFIRIFRKLIKYLLKEI